MSCQLLEVDIRYGILPILPVSMMLRVSTM